MKLTYSCPACRELNRVDDVRRVADLMCVRCGWTRPVAAVQASGSADGAATVVSGELRLDGCLACGNEDLWRQKCFPSSLGLAAVAAGALASSVAWYYHRPVVALGILMAFALADMLLFWLMPDVLVCYRCRARHGTTGDLEQHGPFDHELAERYRQEQLRLEESARA